MIRGQGAGGRGQRTEDREQKTDEFVRLWRAGERDVKPSNGFFCPLNLGRAVRNTLNGN
ncbi:MAG: hypothetical protein LBD06_04980 [Candidatus Accumulibacter sp.]|nr:hypothetical protein [Accumulibacter sp.]